MPTIDRNYKNSGEEMRINPGINSNVKTHQVAKVCKLSRSVPVSEITLQTRGGHKSVHNQEEMAHGMFKR